MGDRERREEGCMGGKGGGGRKESSEGRRKGGRDREMYLFVCLILINEYYWQ